MASISKTQRWLDLIAHLVGRRFPVSVDELMEGIPAYARGWMEGDETTRASVRRTFERDKDELREFGIPIRTATWRDHLGEERQGYTLAPGDFYLPYLRLVERTAEEAGTALEALRRAASLPAFPLAREARSAFRKLAFDLDPDRFDPTPVLFVPEPSETGREEELRRLHEALLARKRVAFTYHGIYRGEPTERDVAPYGLVFRAGHWYLIGHDALRDDVRVFRVSRMEDPRPNRAAPRTPDFQAPESFRVADYLTREPWELGAPEEDSVEARVLFRFPRSLWAERNGKGELVETRAEGATVRRFEVRQVDPFLRWVLSLEGDAEILAPPECRWLVRETVARVAAAHEG